MKHMHLIDITKRNPAFLRQRGASLLEGIAYLGIAAIIILGAVSLLVSAFANAQTNRASEELVALRTGTVKLFMAQSASYTTANLTDQVIGAKANPTTLTVSGTSPSRTLTNAWNGGVVITGATSQFTISYASVPQDACVTLMSSSAGWVSAQVTGQTLRTTTPVTPAQAASDCGATNTITWTAS